MCGFAGKLSWDDSPDPQAVVRMCNKLIHRGPDDSGLVNLRHISLGHRRLSIIDLSEKARQPMVSSDGRYFLVYNGEVYNFGELKRELQKQGVVFKSTSDTEVVLYSYIYWGPACLSKFNGMFALAIWDDKQKELFLARDRFGKKPLYYYHSHRGITFASELSALVLDDQVPQKISLAGLNCYLALGYILSPLTMYDDIYKLEPATWASVSSSKRHLHKVRYWQYEDSFRTKTSEDEDTIGRHILYLLEEATKRRMISDVPVGAFLSGGIDSSSVVTLLKRHHPETLHTFSVGFEEESYNELPDAERLAKLVDTCHHSLICEIGSDRRRLDAAIDLYDEPLADNSLIPMVEVSRLASSYVKVVLSGDGADEIFAGYLTYKADKYYAYARYLPTFMKKFLVAFSGTYKNRKGKLDTKYKQKQFFHGILHKPERAHYSWRMMFHPEERVEILGAQYRELIYDTDPFYAFDKFYDNVKGLHWLDRNLYVDGMTWLPDDILVKVDRATMASSIEARCPYLDPDLVAYAASIPANLKMRFFNTKYILKKSLQALLPQFILDKPKSGFNAPAGAWMNSRRSTNMFLRER
jgi:asparagine synthase (glutamine-hydrolysing)